MKKIIVFFVTALTVACSREDTRTGPFWRADQATYHVVAANWPEAIRGKEFPLEIRAAVEGWNEVACSRFRYHFGGLTKDDSASNRIVFVATDWVEDPAAIGFTIRTSRATGEILDATTFVNGQFLFAPIGHIPLANEIDLTHVLMHESGHMLGLHHSTVDGAIMKAITKRGVSRIALTVDDVVALCDIYPKSE